MFSLLLPLVVGALTAAGGMLAGEPIAVGALAGALPGVQGLAVFFAACATLAAGVTHRASLVLGAGVALAAAGVALHERRDIAA